MMRKGNTIKRKDRSLTDEPTISRNQASVLFNVGKHIFQRRWDQTYQFDIRHIDTENGLRLSLIDVVRRAFPEASDHTQHMIAYEYLLYIKTDRAERRAKRCVEKEPDDDNGGDE